MTIGRITIQLITRQIQQCSEVGQRSRELIDKIQRLGKEKGLVEAILTNSPEVQNISREDIQEIKERCGSKDIEECWKKICSELSERMAEAQENCIKGSEASASANTTASKITRKVKSHIEKKPHLERAISSLRDATTELQEVMTGIFKEVVVTRGALPEELVEEPMEEEEAQKSAIQEQDELTRRLEALKRPEKMEELEGIEEHVFVSADQILLGMQEAEKYEETLKELLDKGWESAHPLLISVPEALRWYETEIPRCETDKENEQLRDQFIAKMTSIYEVKKALQERYEKAVQTWREERVEMVRETLREKQQEPLPAPQPQQPVSQPTPGTRVVGLLGAGVIGAAATTAGNILYDIVKKPSMDTFGRVANEFGTIASMASFQTGPIETVGEITGALGRSSSVLPFAAIARAYSSWGWKDRVFAAATGIPAGFISGSPNLAAVAAFAAGEISRSGLGAKIARTATPVLGRYSARVSGEAGRLAKMGIKKVSKLAMFQKGTQLEAGARRSEAVARARFSAMGQTKVPPVGEAEMEIS